MALQAYPTAFPLIVVLADPERVNFPTIVNGALREIYSRPLGKRLIDEILQGRPMRRLTPPIVDYVVAIMSSNDQSNRTPAPPGTALPGNRAVRASEIGGTYHNRPASQQQGQAAGTATAVRWNPNVITTPDGSRPPFIGLAHELIHARRNVRGFGQPDGDLEERETVGLAFSSDDITENAIRSEHGLPPRRNYGDLEFECGWLAPLIS